MSHLSTIIKRVENQEKSKHNSLFLQSVSNLSEYLILWSDYTLEEKKISKELYEKYKHFLIGTIYDTKKDP